MISSEQNVMKSLVVTVLSTVGLTAVVALDDLRALARELGDFHVVDGIVVGNGWYEIRDAQDLEECILHLRKDLTRRQGVTLEDVGDVRPTGGASVPLMRRV